EPAPPPSAGVPVSVNTPTGSRPGTTGPKTGDDSNAALYIVLMAAGGLVVVGATIYLIASNRKRKKTKQTA
ncbi:MAG: sortase B protein-sorting domain-containing protein, partial [Oscillospiraceae bacterium]|nr:sortase B protein-sorting domain-containing protein [Oscillospiraceae bacterium]